MKAREEGGLIFAKLDDGEDLLGCIEKLCSEFNVSSGIILSNIGMLRDFELNFYSPDGYQPKLYSEPMELVAMHGSIAADGSIHIHCAVADSGAPNAASKSLLSARTADKRQQTAVKR